MSSDTILLDGSQWVQSDGTYVSGEAFKSDTLLHSGDLLDLFGEVNSEQALYDLVERLNGFFGVILKIDGTVYIVSDHVGSRVLFYHTSPDSPIISDNFDRISGMVDQEYPTKNILEFLTATYVSGSDTINSNIQKSLPGSIIAVDTSDNTFQANQYFTYMGDEQKSIEDKNRIYSDWKEIIDSVSQRVAQKANGNQIVIGLSGGRDSRLITMMLDRIGYENVILYTLSSGEGRSYEKRVAQSVAADTGFDWVEISISRDDALDGYQSEKWNEIAKKLGMSGMSHTSPSLVSLHNKIYKNEMISDSGLLLIGHQLFESGEYVIPEVMENKLVSSEVLAQGILKNHYKNYDIDELRQSDKKKIKENIQKKLNISGSVGGNEAFRIMEQWYWRERMPNLLNLRVLPLMQHDVWYPLLDRELVSFWQKVPHSHRYDRNLYDAFVDQLYKETYSIDRKTASQLRYSSKGCVEKMLLSARNTPIGKRIENTKIGSYIRKYVKKLILDNGGTEEEDIQRIYEGDYRYAFIDRELFIEKYPNASNWRYFLAREYLDELDIDMVPNH